VLNVPFGYASAPVASPSYHLARPLRDAAAATRSRFHREPKQDNPWSVRKDHEVGRVRVSGSAELLKTLFRL